MKKELSINAAILLSGQLILSVIGLFVYDAYSNEIVIAFVIAVNLVIGWILNNGYAQKGTLLLIFSYSCILFILQLVTVYLTDDKGV